MKSLEVSARNVVNTDEILSWLGRIAEDYPILTTWITGPVRKWMNKNAPTKPMAVTDTTGLPEWLRKSMTDGLTPENVVLDETIELRLRSVLDYMGWLMASKPDTNLASIGFDVAEARSIKWHVDMAKKAEKVNPIPEDGSEIVKDYGNGWTWRRLVGKPALINEGEAMGHCVGRFGYYERVLRAKLDIFSLRDPQNAPHVTIEANMDQMAIVQIKGRANKEVIDKYLPMVVDWVSDRSWNSIAYDGAVAVETEIYSKQLTRNGFVLKHGPYSSVQEPCRRSHERSFLVFKDGQQIGSYRFDHNMGIVSYQYEADEFLDYMRYVILEQKLRYSTDFALNQGQYVLSQKMWDHIPAGKWYALSTEPKDAVIGQLLAGHPVEYVYSSAAKPVVYHTKATQTTVFDTSVNAGDVQDIALELGLPQEHIVRQLYGDLAHMQKTEVMVDAQALVKRRYAGKTVQTDQGDEQWLSSLLTALKQPNIKQIKDGYLKLKSKDEITDAHMKSVGIPVSGRAINGISAVLMASLAIKNLQPFRKYVFEKPSLLTCWVEVLTAPDHILNALKQYGLAEDTIAHIILLLRNEFMRLVPSDDELAELELETGPVHKVSRTMQWARGHRQDQARSKKLWSAV